MSTIYYKSAAVASNSNLFAMARAINYALLVNLKYARKEFST